MGLGKKKTDKDKAPTLRIRKLSDISAPTPPTVTKAGMSRTQKLAVSEKGALHRVKAQRSIGSLFTTANSAALEHNPLSKPLPQPHTCLPPLRSRKMDARTAPQPRRSSKVDVDDDVNRKKPGTFVETNVWYTRSRTKVHPYSKEVPYMQSYDATSLDNDHYSELLLERLNPGSPSFWDYGKKPPLTVLDLGCGQGHWALYAASVWKNSQITGFDLMDICLPAFSTTENVNFIRGNFLLKLPFPSKSFEYVRMANLSLCIPYDHWLPLLTEVRRVLTNGGRLELIDDQMMFPFGEEPQLKDPIIAHTKTESPQSSFFDFSNDDDSSEGDDDATLEDETSASTTSTLVSDRASRDFFDKLPSSKRSSAQSNVSTSVGSDTHVSDLPPPLSISIPTSTLPLEATISPSPTVTQADFNALDSDCGTIAHSPTITDHTRHRKTASTSSTGSQSEALSFWRSRKQASMEMEAIYEHVLVHKYGIHPRPSEFVVDTMRQIFGKGNAGKVRSYHIKLAPFDSPIGPGGSLAPTTDDASHKSDTPKKQQWKNAGDKKEKKEKRRKLEKPDSPRGASFDEPPVPPQPPVVTAKAASRLGLVPTVPPLPPRRVSSELSSGSESSDSYTDPHRSSQLPVVSAKAASRLGIPVNPPPVPPKSEHIRRSYINTGAQKAKEVPRTSGGIRLGTPLVFPVAEEDTAPSPISITPTVSYSGDEQVEQERAASPSLGRTDSSESEQSASSSSSSSSEPSSDVGGAVQPPVLSAKAAGRLGISYSVLAAASAAHSRGSGVMVPVQSPGLLVWPSTYIPMSPSELEMHSCKWVQSLLGCRHALREHITGEFEGKRLVDDAEFEEAIWDYECFRRSRFHWPLDNPDLFDEDGFPESPTAPTQTTPPKEQRPAHSRDDSFESFNGQYRRDELTHVRTIRVFEAVKVVDEKSLVAMLFPSHSSRSS
ncbi:hypothetical protein EST38_g1268 [Candolleomyces aberdarensis]|uniref:Methyltransferase domain-containing protein n=1 Tax=Candolleomyces aberdarensis TaxID=2316362 RepID=A0A4Q2DZS9_9AGAR|nr:hypothetical protein EST38_g1268 [Candolleomyces aberdarensis]